jgi:hypothetical protein
LASRKLEERVEQLRQLRSNPSNPEIDAILRKALADRSGLIIAEAAKTIGELHLSSWISQLLDAFSRLFVDSVKADPKCFGKTAIVRSLVQLDYSESQPFIRGLRHVQMEPTMGGQEDSAAQLRANCALALVQCTDLRRFEILSYLVEALTDALDPVRIEAVRALHQLAGDEATLLLRLKARFGDRRPLIVGHVFDALLSLERERAVPFVAEYLDSSDDALRDEAALALGSSRLARALEVLTHRWQQSRGGFAEVLLRAISSSRLPDAIDFLLNVLKTGTSQQATAALDALKLHKDTPEIQIKIEEAQIQRRQITL